MNFQNPDVCILNLKTLTQTGTSYSLLPSVQKRMTTELRVRCNCSLASRQALLKAANVAAPHGPECRPSLSSSQTASWASWSVTVTTASTPDWSVGHAVDETVPQFMPHMMESAVCTVVNCPAASEALRHEAVVGSTAMTDEASLEGWPSNGGLL